NDVVQALTVAYNLLVGGLLVPILGGLLWRRGTAQGALAAVAVGGLTVVVLMATFGILANEPILYGLLSSLAVYVVVSLATPPTRQSSPPGANASPAAPPKPNPCRNGSPPASRVVRADITYAPKRRKEGSSMSSNETPRGPVDSSRVPRYAGPATFARLPRLD